MSAAIQNSPTARPVGFLTRAGVATGGTLLVALLAYLVLRPAPEQIVETYGKKTSRGGESVNGSSVLAAMFEHAGHRVEATSYLSRRATAFDVIVWFPDNFQPPAASHREFLENWLAEEPNRTLIYVGRDFDAAAPYWQTALSTAPPGEVREVLHRFAQAEATHDGRRAGMPKERYSRWFTVQRDAPRLDVRGVRGEWAAGIDASQAAITLRSRFGVPTKTLPKSAAAGAAGTGPVTVGPGPKSNRNRRSRQKASPAMPFTVTPDFDEAADTDDRTAVWLESDTGDPIVMQHTNRRRWGADRQLLVVTNGSFLLNLPLVNREHRKLAGRLIDACGDPGHVLFLESGPGGPPIVSGFTSGGWEVLTVWPFGAITMHLALLGILAGFALYPIFGRPRPLPPEAPSEFSKHAEAVGELLARTGDRGYAVARLTQYHAHCKRESGVSHASQESPTPQK